MLTTIENDGFDQLVTVQAGHLRFGFGQISPASGGTPAIQYERPRLGATPLTLRTAAAYSFRGYQAYDLQLGVFDRPAPYPFAGDGFLGAPFDFDNRSVAPLDELLYLDLYYQRFPKEEFFGSDRPRATPTAAVTRSSVVGWTWSPAINRRGG